MVLLTLASAATTRMVYDKLLEKKGLCPHFASEVNAARVSHYVEAMPGVFFRIGTEVCSFCTHAKSEGTRDSCIYEKAIEMANTTTTTTTTHHPQQQLHVEVHINTEMLHECHKKVMELWYYSVFLLMTLLVCSLTCTWYVSATIAAPSPSKTVAPLTLTVHHRRFILAVKRGEAQDVLDVAYTEVACDGRVTHSVCRVDEYAMVPSLSEDGVVELLECKQLEGKSV